LLKGGKRIHFYSSKDFKKGKHFFPCFVFAKNNWDDFGYKTQYEIEYYPSHDPAESIFLGSVKFFDKDEKNGDLPNSFFSLDTNFCSLGQSNGFYSNLREFLDTETSDYYLDAVNDLAFNRGLVDSFENENIFQISLLRSSEVI
jgi:hypothetical protein